MTTIPGPARISTQESSARRSLHYERLLDIGLPIIAILASFLVGGIFLLGLDISPIEAYTAL
ncbi:MAG: hypothetical protein L0Y56_21560, partial [Nitrospira sp.]|nr:hypothetical protein [Nitrospira sp.]